MKYTCNTISTLNPEPMSNVALLHFQEGGCIPCETRGTVDALNFLFDDPRGCEIVWTSDGGGLSTIMTKQDFIERTGREIEPGESVEIEEEELEDTVYIN